MAISGKQRLFNKIVRHIRRQGVASMLPGVDNGCAYRGENGTRCAIGCAIPNSIYNPKMENKTGTMILMDKAFPKLTAHFKRLYDIDINIANDMSFIRRMQSAHDSDLQCGGLADFEERIKVTAYLHNLKIPK